MNQTQKIITLQSLIGGLSKNELEKYNEQVGKNNFKFNSEWLDHCLLTIKKIKSI